VLVTALAALSLTIVQPVLAGLLSVAIDTGLATAISLYVCAILSVPGLLFTALVAAITFIDQLYPEQPGFDGACRVLSTKHRWATLAWLIGGLTVVAIAAYASVRWIGELGFGFAVFLEVLIVSLWVRFSGRTVSHGSRMRTRFVRHAVCSRASDSRFRGLLN